MLGLRVRHDRADADREVVSGLARALELVVSVLKGGEVASVHLHDFPTVFGVSLEELLQVCQRLGRVSALHR